MLLVAWGKLRKPHILKSTLKFKPSGKTNVFQKPAQAEWRSAVPSHARVSCEQCGHDIRSYLRSPKRTECGACLTVPVRLMQKPKVLQPKTTQTRAGTEPKERKLSCFGQDSHVISKLNEASPQPNLSRNSHDLPPHGDYTW